MSGSRIYPMSGKKINTPVSPSNSWFKDDITPTTRKQFIDKWEVCGVYPFKIEQQHEMVWTDEHKAEMAALTPQEKAFMKMQMNSMYGMMPTWVAGGAYINHPGGSIGIDMNPIKTRYYMASNGTAHKEVIVPHEGTANCIQKQRLVAHFEHKISKTSKKKKTEIEKLTKIIEMHQGEIDIYIDEFPERFI